MPIDFIPSNFDVSRFIRTGAGTCESYPTPHPGDEGKMRFGGVMSHLNYDCPIAKPGQVGSMPLMMWIGNTGGNAHSTYESLRTTGDSTVAGGPINRSAYYLFAMIDTVRNKVVKPACVIFYYTVIRRDTKPFTSPNSEFGTQQAAQNLPVGLRMIFGQKTGEPAPKVWYRGNGDSGEYRATLAELADAGGSGPVIMRISSPSCWDGVNIDSPDHRSHLAYPVQDMYGNTMCPPTHPVPIPQISMLIFYEPDGEDFRNWKWSADIARGLPGGTSSRVFYMEAWDRPVLEEKAGKFIMGIGPGAELHTGVSGQLCTPTQEALDESHLIGFYNNPGTQPLSERYMDIPPNPAAPAPTPTTPTPTPTPTPAPAYSWQSYKSGKTTLYKILEGATPRVNSLSLAECRWLCGVLKIKAP